MIAKLKEWITALELEYNYTKEEIAAMYLNTVEYGSNAYGVKSAAQTFSTGSPTSSTCRRPPCWWAWSTLHAYALSTGGVWFGAGWGCLSDFRCPRYYVAVDSFGLFVSLTSF